MNRDAPAHRRAIRRVAHRRVPLPGVLPGDPRLAAGHPGRSLIENTVRVIIVILASFLYIYSSLVMSFEIVLVNTQP